jgi:hypothetical protein
MKRTFQYRASEDRVYDSTMETPRQRRLKCQREATLAKHHCLIENILGGILILALIIVLSFL